MKDGDRLFPNSERERSPIFPECDRFFTNKRNRVSAVNIKVNCETEKETRFLGSGGAIAFLLKTRNRVSVVNINVNCGTRKETRFLGSGGAIAFCPKPRNRVSVINILSELWQADA